MVGWLVEFFSDVLSGWILQNFPWFSSLQPPPCLLSAFPSIELAVPNFKAMSIRLYFNVFVMGKPKKNGFLLTLWLLSQRTNCICKALPLSQHEPHPCLTPFHNSSLPISHPLWPGLKWNYSSLCCWLNGRGKKTKNVVHYLFIWVNGCDKYRMVTFGLFPEFPSFPVIFSEQSQCFFFPLQWDNSLGCYSSVKQERGKQEK